MSYIKSYLIALFRIASILGLIYLVASFIFGVDSTIPFIYLSVVAALGGPLDLLIRGGNEHA